MCVHAHFCVAQTRGKFYHIQHIQKRQFLHYIKSLINKKKNKQKIGQRIGTNISPKYIYIKGLKTYGKLFPCSQISVNINLHEVICQYKR